MAAKLSTLTATKALLILAMEVIAVVVAALDKTVKVSMAVLIVVVVCVAIVVVFLVVVEFLVVVVVFGVGIVEVSAGVVGDVSICFFRIFPSAQIVYVGFPMYKGLIYRALSIYIYRCRGLYIGPYM